jgi:hypothetical protein
MKRIANKDDVDNVGEFAWGDENGVRYIMIALPCPSPTAPDNYILNYLPVCTVNKADKAWLWDGNLDAPTLSPSIHCIGHWHGWVRAGTLVEA